MQTVVVYESRFGNTERLAEAIAASLGGPTRLQVVAQAALDAHALEGAELVVVGGPTQGHGVSPALRSWLERLPPDALRGASAAAFDTRVPGARWLTGSAAVGIAHRLEKRGARLVSDPASFLVSGREGPLADGELARARAWGAGLLERAGAQAA
jgi:flavodoxin